MSDTAAKTDIKSKTLGMAAYEQIRSDIVTCKLAPGAALSEAKLAESYGYGLAPVRSALAKLAQEGLISRQARIGNFVAPITLQSIKDVFEMRLLLEPYLARVAASRIVETQLAELESYCEYDYIHGDKDSTAKFLKLNKKFHMGVADAAGNDRMSLSLSLLLDELERMVHLGLMYTDRSQEHQQEHRALIAALRAGDGDRAEKLSTEQVDVARRMVLDAAISNTNLSEINLAGVLK